MRKLLVTVILAVVFIIGGFAAFVETIRLSPIQFGFQCLAYNVYWESRNEQFFGKRLVAYVTLARAAGDRQWWGGETLCGVVHYKKKNADKTETPAFAWTTDGDIKHRIPQNWWQFAESVWASLLTWATVPTPPQAQYAKARYYMNPVKAQTRGECWFKTSLKFVGAVGNHHFYRELYPLEEKPTPPKECLSQRQGSVLTKKKK